MWGTEQSSVLSRRVCERQPRAVRLEDRRDLEYKAAQVAFHSYGMGSNRRTEEGNGRPRFVRLEPESKRMQECHL